MKTESHILTNGLRLVHREIPYSRAVHCGFVINAGSRDESPEEGGIAHFIEHMLFKGTRRRRTFHILNYLESVGGDLNAYTTKEKTCLYASAMTADLQRAMNLLGDIVFNSVFPEREIEKERSVIAEEIDMYNDSPEDVVFEEFDRLCFGDHPLAAPIAGSKETIARFHGEDFREFIRRNYTQERVVFATTGNLPFRKVIRLAERIFGDYVLPQAQHRQLLEPAYSHGEQRIAMQVQQTHRVIGGLAWPVRQGHYVGFSLLNNFLGGPANNTLLNLNIREKFGLSYNIFSMYSSYLESGNWGIYFACEPKNVDRITSLALRELRQLRDKKLGTLKLNQIKKQMIGQITLGAEQSRGRMLVAAQNFLDFGRDFHQEDLAAEIEALTASDLLETANIAFDPNRLSFATAGAE